MTRFELVNFARNNPASSPMNRDMPTEWLKIMLEEIERRREDAQRGREEESRRRAEPPGEAARTPPDAATLS